jgi:hypothetical protein
LLPRSGDLDAECEALIRDLESAQYVEHLAVFCLPGAERQAQPFGRSLAWRAYQSLESRMEDPDRGSTAPGPGTGISVADEAAIGSTAWDVLLCPGFAGRLTELARYARHGMWWVSVDADPAMRPDVRCQLGVMSGGTTPMSISLWRRNGRADEPELLETASVRQVSGFSLRKNLSALAPLRRQIWLVTLARLHRNGSITARSAESATPANDAVTFPAPVLVRMAARQVGHRFRQRNSAQGWQVGVRPLLASGTAFDNPEGYSWLTPPKQSWLADPCPVVVGGRTWLFMEKFDTWRGLGEICCCELADDGSPGELLDVLRRPYHLSYPHVFLHEGEVFMIPETGTHDTVELYRAVGFPQQWELVRVLHRAPAFDTTVLIFQNRFWFFTSIVEGLDRVASQLLLFSSSRPDGDWTLHPASPLSMDCRWSRSGGGVFLQNDRLIRPAQDCSRIYGGATIFREIESINDVDFREKSIAALTPDAWAHEGAIGVHTYDRAGCVEVVDRLLSWRQSPRTGP